MYRIRKWVYHSSYWCILTTKKMHHTKKKTSSYEITPGMVGPESFAFSAETL